MSDEMLRQMMIEPVSRYDNTKKKIEDHSYGRKSTIIKLQKEM